MAWPRVDSAEQSRRARLRWARDAQRITRACQQCRRVIPVRPSLVGRKRFCSRRCLGMWSVRRRVPTRGERLLGSELAERGVVFSYQERFGRFVLDFLIDSLVIEVNGAYWHGLPKNKQRDAEKRNALQAAGLRLVEVDAELVECKPSDIAEEIIRRFALPTGTRYIWSPRRRVCSVQGCQALASKAKLCGAHYLRLRRHGSVDADRSVRGHGASCRVSGCDRPYHGRGLCDRHYQRWRKHGSTDRRPSHRAKLTAAGVGEIREARLRGVSLKVLAEQFGVTDGHISNILARRCWK